MKKNILQNIKNSKVVATVFLLSLSICPSLAIAAAIDFKGLVQIIIGMVQAVVPLIVGLTLLVFIWGIFQLVKSNSEDSRKEAIAVITYGIIALFVMVSVWGLVYVLTSTFFTGGLVIPQLKTS